MSNVITFPIGRGKEAIVDAADYPLVVDYPWRAYRARTAPDLWYARARFVRNGRLETYLLHRLITGALPRFNVHHDNGSGLDCRRANMKVLSVSEHTSLHHRGATYQSRDLDNRESLIERRPMVPLLGGKVYLVMGIYQMSPSSDWRFCFTTPNGTIDLGPYRDETSAIAAFIDAHIRLYGERPNTIPVYVS